MHKHIWTLSFTLLLAAGCTQGDSTGSVDLGGGGNSDLGGGSSDLAMGGSPDDGGGGSQDGGTGGGPDGGTGGPDGGGGVLQPGVNLLAGQLGGSGSADRVGTTARFYNPCAVATDGIGNLYVADTNNNLLRKIVLATGAVSTVAQTVGSSCGVAADGAGNLYFSDLGTYAIHKVVVATGVVTKLAGGGLGSADGVGAAATFNSPNGLSWDGAGNLFVADTGNHTIRQIVVATGAVTTLAGTAGMSGGADGTGAAARFNGSYGVAADKAGNVYVADTRNHAVRRIVVSTGVVTTVAGLAGTSGNVDATGSAARFNLPQAVAVDAAGSLYVTDIYNLTVRKIVAATGAVTTLAGKALTPGSVDGVGTAAQFQYMGGIALDGTANLYVSEVSGGGSIRKVDATTAAVTTFAGLPSAAGGADGTGMAAQFRGPSGMTTDGQGNLFVADKDNSTIRQIVAATGAVTTLAGKPTNSGTANGVGAAAQFHYPTGVAADGAGNLYVADSSSNTIRKIAISTRTVTLMAGAPDSSGSTDGPAGGARFNSPQDLALDQAGNMYVSDSGNCTIRKIVLATGAVSTIAGTAGSCMDKDGTGAAARFTSPLGLAADKAGSLYVTDVGASTIRKVDLATGAVTTLAGVAGMIGSADGMGTAARFRGPQRVLVDGAGTLLISDTANQTLRKLDLATGSVTTVLGVVGQRGVALGAVPGGLNYPVGLARLPSGGLAVVSNGENAVLIVGGL